MLQLRFFFHFNFNLNFFPRSKKILPGKWIQLSAGILRCSERLALKSGHYTVKILFVPDYTYLNMLPSQAVLHFFYLSALTPSSFRSTGCHFFHIALHPWSEKTFRKSRDWLGHLVPQTNALTFAVSFKVSARTNPKMEFMHSYRLFSDL